MLFCCLWRNSEASGHKHFFVISRLNKLCCLQPAITVTTCHGPALITPGWSQLWQHEMKPDISSELRFMPTPPAFNAPVRGSPSEYCHDVWYGKTRIVWLPIVKKVLCLLVLMDTQRDGRTPHDSIGRACITSRRRFCHATHDCVALYVDIILHRGRFWAKSAALGSVRWWCFRSCWMALVHNIAWQKLQKDDNVCMPLLVISDSMTSSEGISSHKSYGMFPSELMASTSASLHAAFHKHS